MHYTTQRNGASRHAAIHIRADRTATRLRHCAYTGNIGWVALLESGLLTFLSACASMGTTAIPPSAPRAVIADVSPQTDVVTVVPFQLADQPAPGFVLIPAEVDGHRGTFLLDTGAPLIILNSMYIQRSTLGGMDTNTAGSPPSGQSPQIPITVHTLRIGTLVHHLDSTHVESPLAFQSNAIILTDPRLQQFGRPVLGFLGLPALAPFETIVDYAHQRIILIRLDAAGHRLATVPQYTPAATLALVPVAISGETQPQQYGVSVRAGGLHGTMALDTGLPTNILKITTRQRLGRHVSDTQFGWTLDHLLVGDRSYDNVRFMPEADENGLGYPFLSQNGVVGFNFRTCQLIFYHPRT